MKIFKWLDECQWYHGCFSGHNSLQSGQRAIQRRNSQGQGEDREGNPHPRQAGALAGESLHLTYTGHINCA